MNSESPSDGFGVFIQCDRSSETVSPSKASQIQSKSDLQQTILVRKYRVSPTSAMKHMLMAHLAGSEMVLGAV